MGNFKFCKLKKMTRDIVTIHGFFNYKTCTIQSLCTCHFHSHCEQQYYNISTCTANRNNTDTLLIL